MIAIRKKIVEWADSFVRPALMGIDISDTSLKFLRFRSGPRLSFDVWGELPLPEGVIVNGEVKDAEKIIATIRAWLARDGKRFRGSFVALSLPEEKSFLRVIQIPKVKQTDIANAIRWEIEANIPFPIEELAYDYEVAESRDNLDHLDVVVSAFPKTVVDGYVQVARGAGFYPAVLELESQAILRSVIPDLHDAVARLIVDIGRNRTGFVVAAGGTILFTKTIAFGGRMLEDNIMKALGVDSARAIRLKQEQGLNPTFEDGALFRALVPGVSVLTDELQRAANFYQAHGSHAHGVESMVREVILAGGDANLAGIDTYCASVLKLPVRRADPMGAIRDRVVSPVPPFSKQQSLALATVIGLALWGIR